MAEPIEVPDEQFTSKSETAQCFQKISLLADVQAAMGELMAIHNQEVIALLAEDFGRIAELRSTLQAARNHKARLIDLYREHVMSHGC